MRREGTGKGKKENYVHLNAVTVTALLESNSNNKPTDRL
jgi:hypothetical protein